MQLRGGIYKNITIRDIYRNVDSSCLLYLDAGNPASYPGSGTTWYDLSNYQNNTFSSQNAVWNGGNSGYFMMTDPCWFQTTASKYNVTYTGKTVFMSAMLVGTMNNGQYRCMFGSNGSNRNFNLYFWYNGGAYYLHYSAAGTGSVSVPMNYTSGTWGTFAFTHTTSGVQTYYYNGKQLGPAQSGITFSQYLATSSENVGASDNYWNGRVGVTAIYGRALSNSEILSMHNGVKNRYGI